MPLRKWAVALVVVLLLSFTATAAEEVRIDAVYPLTGPMASTGQDCRSGVELALDIINNSYDLDFPLRSRKGHLGWTAIAHYLR